MRSKLTVLSLILIFSFGYPALAQDQGTSGGKSIRETLGKLAAGNDTEIAPAFADPIGYQQFRYVDMAGAAVAHIRAAQAKLEANQEVCSGLEAAKTAYLDAAGTDDANETGVKLAEASEACAVVTEISTNIKAERIEVTKAWSDLIKPMTDKIDGLRKSVDELRADLTKANASNAELKARMIVVEGLLDAMKSICIGKPSISWCGMFKTETEEVVKAE